MDRQSVYSLSVLAPDPDQHEDSRSQIQAQLREFILEFRLDNIFIYRYDLSRDIINHMELTLPQRSDTGECARQTILLRR